MLWRAGNFTACLVCYDEDSCCGGGKLWEPENEEEDDETMF